MTRGGVGSNLGMAVAAGAVENAEAQFERAEEQFEQAEEQAELAGHLVQSENNKMTEIDDLKAKLALRDGTIRGLQKRNTQLEAEAVLTASAP